jgi:hypothetical protein
MKKTRTGGDGRRKRTRARVKELSVKKADRVKGGYGTGVYRGGVRVAVVDVTGE